MPIKEIVLNLFKKNQINYDFDVIGPGSIQVFVECGDWKHDHLFLDHIMKEAGFEWLGDRLTREDGSDCYSSIHYYKWNGEESETESVK